MDRSRVDLVEDSLFVEWLTRGEVVMLLDPGVVEHAVEVGKLLGDVPCDLTDGGGIGHVEDAGPHPRIRLADRHQGGFPSPADDDLVAELVERLGESSTDSRTAASDEDRVGLHSHRDGYLPRQDPEIPERYSTCQLSPPQDNRSL
jgi:hypothetical protein